AHQHWLMPLLIGWLVMLVPFLNPVQLLKSGTDTKSMWRGWIFQIAGYALIIGIPFATVWFIGRHNVSGIADRWDRDLVASDIVDWEKFWKKMRQDAIDPQTPAFNLLGKMDAVAGKSNKLM